MLKDYDYESVRQAFEESVAQNKMTLAYVRTVARNVYEKNTIKRYTDTHEIIKQEDKKRYNPAIDGSLLEIAGLKKMPEPVKDESYKNNPEYKRKEQLFIQEVEK